MTDAGFGGAPPPTAAVSAGANGIHPATPLGHDRATFLDVVAAEWIKLRSIRSTMITSLVTIVVAVGIGLLVCLVVANNAKNTSGTDPTGISLVGVHLAQLVVAILGVMAVTSEYASGTIRVTLLASPRRTTLLLAKLLVIGIVCFVLGEVVAFASFGIGQAILHGNYASASLSQPQVLRAVVGAGLYLTVLGLLGAGFGFLLRSSAAGIAVVVAVIFVLPIITDLIPGRIGADLSKYWPTIAGVEILTVRHGVDTSVMAPWTGFGVLLAFVAAVLVAGWAVLERRDA